MAGEEVRGLARVDGAAAPDRDQAVEGLGPRILGGLLHRPVGGLDLDAVVDVGLHALLLEEPAHALGQPELGQVRLGEDQRGPDADRCARSRSSIAPRPNLIGDISITNTVSVGERHAFHAGLSVFRQFPAPGGTAR